MIRLHGRLVKIRCRAYQLGAGIYNLRFRTGKVDSKTRGRICDGKVEMSYLSKVEMSY
jgi:hypothetical protein